MIFGGRFNRQLKTFSAWQTSLEHSILCDRRFYDKVAYHSVTALQTFKTQNSQIAIISSGKLFHIKEAGIDWLVNWHTVREKGRNVCHQRCMSLLPCS